MRYVVVPDEYPHLAHVSEEHDDGGVLLGEDVCLTVAQANIIAWALNAIAKGLSLCRLHPEIAAIGREWSTVDTIYDGPTDGVAP